MAYHTPLAYVPDIILVRDKFNFFDSGNTLSGGVQENMSQQTQEEDMACSLHQPPSVGLAGWRTCRPVSLGIELFSPLIFVSQFSCYSSLYYLSLSMQIGRLPYDIVVFCPQAPRGLCCKVLRIPSTVFLLVLLVISRCPSP